ncbi:hypothetical protein G6F62_004849 [Rhizopus arrhizus]|nr:hypothetical protein G6F62_004849 [Rhizopus arrhizus]
MSVNGCYWALLSLNDNFQFIHLPELGRDIYGKSPVDTLLFQSLFNFIHPQELPLAKADLLNFMKIKSLAGAVTRCRLNKIIEEDECKMTDDWIMTDIILYAATSKTLLAFFHNTHSETCLDKKQLNYSHDPRIMINLKRYSSPITLDHLLRVFQIYDIKSNQILLSWPLYSSISEDVHHPLYPAETRRGFIESIRKIALSDLNSSQSSSSSTLGCSQHVYSSSTVTLMPYGLCHVEKVIIYYGPIVFTSFQITPTQKPCYPHRSIERLPSIRELFNKPTQEIDHKQLPPLTTTIKETSKIWKGRFIMLEKKCEICGASTSPEWRKGPSGHKTLCNACGLRYARLVAKQEKLLQHTKHKPVILSNSQKKKKLL